MTYYILRPVNAKAEAICQYSTEECYGEKVWYVGSTMNHFFAAIAEIGEEYGRGSKWELLDSDGMWEAKTLGLPSISAIIEV